MDGQERRLDRNREIEQRPTTIVLYFSYRLMVDMSCGKACQKLWNNYLNKYGDFRERARAIQNDQQCLTQFPLIRIQRMSSFPVRRFVLVDHHRKSSHSLLPIECRHLSLNKSDREKLEKLIEAENFPDNIFPSRTESRSRTSIDHENSLSITDQIPSPMHSIFRKNITQNVEESSNQKSELVTTASRMINPYAQLIKRLHQAEKTKQEYSDTEFSYQSLDSTIDESTHNRIDQLLSFLRSLDDTTDHSIDEQALIALFSVDNHLSSSIYVPMTIQQLNVVPKTILHSLENTSGNEHILHQIETKKSKKNRPLPNIRANQSSLNKDSQTSYFLNQDNELHSRLSHTYTIKAFKDYLIEHHKSTRLPKLFDDLDRYSRNQFLY